MGKVRQRKETGKLYLDFFYQGLRLREQTARRVPIAAIPAYLSVHTQCPGWLPAVGDSVRGLFCHRLAPLYRPYTGRHFDGHVQCC